MRDRPHKPYNTRKRNKAGATDNADRTHMRDKRDKTEMIYKIRKTDK